MAELIEGGAELLATSVVQGTALIMVTAVVALLLRRTRPALLAALWTVALLKFAFPIAPELPIALGNLLGGMGEVSLGADSALAAGSALSTSSLRVIADAPVFPWVLAILVATWLLGFALVSARRIHMALVMSRRVAVLPAADSEVAAAVSRAAEQIGVARIPAVRVDPGGAGAYIVGWLRPVLVVPAWPSPAQLQAILLHELAHIRRRDPLLRAVQVAVTTVFYFWPPVAWVSRQLDLAREQACDQWAVSAGGLRPGAFARVLVEVATRARGLQAPGLAMAPRPGHLERRVVHLLTRKQRPAMSAAMAALVLGWSAVALAAAERDPATEMGETLCATDPRIGEQIMANHPDADTDGDGSLSKDEVCAHQLRMQRKLVDEVVSTLPSEALAQADFDGDGILTDGEIERLKDRLVVTVRTDDDASQSQLLLHLESPLRPERLSRHDFATVESSMFALETAEVSGAVCEPGIGRCAMVEGRPDDSVVFIDVVRKRSEETD